MRLFRIIGDLLIGRITLLVMVCYLFLPSFHLSTLPAAEEKEDKDEGGRKLANEQTSAFELEFIFGAFNVMSTRCHWMHI